MYPICKPTLTHPSSWNVAVHTSHESRAVSFVRANDRSHFTCVKREKSRRGKSNLAELANNGIAAKADSIPSRSYLSCYRSSATRRATRMKGMKRKKAKLAFVNTARSAFKPICMTRRQACTFELRSPAHGVSINAKREHVSLLVEAHFIAERRESSVEQRTKQLPLANNQHYRAFVITGGYTCAHYLINPAFVYVSTMQPQPYSLRRTTRQPTSHLEQREFFVLADTPASVAHP